MGEARCPLTVYEQYTRSKEMKNCVYLCGGMEGFKEEEMKGWRAEATEHLSMAGITTLDPTRRVHMHLHKGVRYEPNQCNRIVKQDLQDIGNSTVLLCDMREGQPGKRWGSMAEIAHAHTKNKIIIVWIDKEDQRHPFLEFYATEIYTDLEEALDAVTSYYE